MMSGKRSKDQSLMRKRLMCWVQSHYDLSRSTECSSSPLQVQVFLIVDWDCDAGRLARQPWSVVEVSATCEAHDEEADTSFPMTPEVVSQDHVYRSQ